MELQTKEAKVTGDIINRLQKIAADIGQKESYDMILERSQVLYAPTKTDLTERVIQSFNAGQGK
jgi:Skp family chaperone for outer membrane proteins